MFVDGDFEKAVLEILELLFLGFGIIWFFFYWFVRNWPYLILLLGGFLFLFVFFGRFFVLICQLN